MKRIVYGSLSVLTAVCTVFVAAKAEVFTEDKASPAADEKVVVNDANEASKAFGGGLPSLSDELGNRLGGGLDGRLSKGDALSANEAALNQALLGGNTAKAAPSTSSLGLAGKSAAGSSFSSLAAAPNSISSRSVPSSLSSGVTSFRSVAQPSLIQTPQAQAPQIQLSQSTTPSKPSTGTSDAGVDAGTTVVSPATKPSTGLTPNSPSAPNAVGVPTVPTSGATLTGPSADPSEASSLGVDASKPELDTEIESDAAISPAAPANSFSPSGGPSGATDNSPANSLDGGAVEIGQPVTEGDDPFAAPGKTPSGIGAETNVDSLDAEPEADSAETDADSTDTEAGADALGTGVDSMGTESGADSMDADTGADALGADDADTEGVDAEDSSTIDDASGDTDSDVMLNEPAPGRSVPGGTAPSVEADEESLPAPSTGSPTLEAPGGSNLGTPSPGTTPPSGTLSPSAPSAPSGITPSAPGSTPSAPGGTLSPIEPVTPSPLSPIEEEAVPGDLPTSGTESFGSSDRLVGEGFSPFQLSYLAIGGGLEGIPGGSMLLSAYNSGELSAADIVDAGAASNRLGTDASNEADYTAGVDRFLELLTKDARNN